MNLKPFFLFIAIMLCFATSCKKHIKKHIGPQTDIYMAGSLRKYYSQRDKDTISTATYWKNGTPVQLTDSLTDAVATGIGVNKSDVYVVGRISHKINNSYITSSAAYWRNGILTQLGEGTVDGIAFKGNDVYMVGTAWGKGQDQAIYWKNGKAFSLGKGRLTSIYIDGDDIYMAGFRLYAVEMPSASYLVKNYDYYPAATYWKNGKPIALNDTTYGKTHANGIFVQDGEVYTAGSEDDKYSKAVYWKNGHTHQLVYQPHPMASASGITADEYGRYLACGSIYVGHNNYLAVYWENDRLRSLPRIGKNSNADAICVLGKNIYIVGNDQYYPVYWKNGNRVEVGKSRGVITSVALVNY